MIWVVNTHTETGALVNNGLALLGHTYGEVD
jgi:hypothetical protein